VGQSGKDTVVDRFLGFITKDVVKLELESTDKAGVIAELVGLLARAGHVEKKDQDAVVQAILKRESLGSTGIGNKLAIPHAKACPHVRQLVGAFGRSSRGIEFGAIDGEPCKVFFLMVSPAGGVEAHLKVLQKLAALGRDDHFCRFLIEARDADEVIALFREAEEK
jgi:mannitol/fructose-specific phosphotransferase system IIA component (Ntr-type)